MLLTITAPGQQANLLPRILGMNPGSQYRVALPEAKATLYFPNQVGRDSRAALFIEVTKPIPGMPELRNAPVDGPASILPLPSASHLVAAIEQGFGLDAASGQMRRGCGLAAELPLRVSVRYLFQPGKLAHAKDAFLSLGWNATMTEVPFGDMPTRWGKTGFVELTLQFSGTLSRALEHLGHLLPLLAPQSQTRVPGLNPGSASLSQIVARFDTSGGYSLSDGLYRPRQGLASQRIGAVLAVLTHLGAKTVADLGCGRGDLLVILAHDGRYAKVTGVEIDNAMLQLAARRLRLHWLPNHRQMHVRLVHGSVLAPDPRLRGFDAVVLMEVLEHLDPLDVDRVVDAIFGDARPRSVLVTTPNAEHTARFPGLGQMGMRHPDHKFEWTRSEFARWASKVESAYGYVADVAGIGSWDRMVGAPTQLALFARRDGACRR